MTKIYRPKDGTYRCVNDPGDTREYVLRRPWGCTRRRTSLRQALERLMEAGAIPKMDDEFASRLWTMNMFTITSANGFAKPNLLLADGMIDMMLTSKLPGITNNPPA